MSLSTYALFYKRYGVRLASQLTSPVLTECKLFQLPQNSIYHYASYTGIELGPAPDDMGFRGQTRQILVDNISTPYEFKGVARRVVSNDSELAKDYRIQNRRIRILKDLETAFRDEQSLVTINYSFINKTYKYTRTLFTEYFKWYNIFNTVILKMADLVNLTNRQQFYFLSVPPLIPSVSTLDSIGSDITQSQLKLVKESNGFTLTEIWKWLGEERSSSLLSKIPLEKIHLINFVIQENSKWTVINLGVLNSFRALAKNEVVMKLFHEAHSPASPVAVQKRFLVYMMKIMEMRTATANTVTADDVGVNAFDEEASSSTGVDTDDSNDTISKKVDIGTVSEVSNTTDLIDEGGDDEVSALTPQEIQAQLDQEEIEINLQLAKLNDISTKVETEAKSEHANLSELLKESDDDITAGVMKVCDTLAAEGMLTAGEYRRFEKLSQWSVSAPNPYGSAETLDQFRKVDPQKLVLKKENSLVKAIGVLDESMLGSVLHDFDKKYVDEVLPRHVTGMVSSVQKAGIAVTGYEIETIDDVLGTFEAHTVKLQPVVGAQTTISFRIPKIQEDGSWTSNGTKYKMKKLRGD